MPNKDDSADCRGADYRWLVGPAAAGLLNELTQADQPLHTAVAKLRRRFSANRTSLLLEQVELRQRATAKFSRASQMFFTRIGLQQATDECLARYKANRYAAYSAIVDVCCGVGGDLIALAQLVPCTGIDRDPSIACLAQANLEVYGVMAGSITVGDASAASLTRCDAWHADPDRRPSGRRSTQVGSSSPDDQTLDAMRAACPHAGIKLAPAADTPESWTRSAEREWISSRGECRQQVAWFGGLTSVAGQRRATRLDAHGDVEATLLGDGGKRAPLAAVIGAYLFEPDSAVLAAKLTGELASRYRLARVSPGIGYLTGDHQVTDPLLSSFAVQEVLPWRRGKIADCLRSRGIGRLEIKHRGLQLDPDRLRRELKPSGDAEATLLVFPHAGKTVAVIAARQGVL